jgi:asparagine synthase (glutamine-hydrolysing)
LSAIYGVYRFDGAPVDPRWLEQMKAAMANYGPHGEGSKVEGPVGMGHLLLKVNPEDAFEVQPLMGNRGLVVCAARLDNRSELVEGLNLHAADALRLSDGHLVSLAFDRWGEDLCSRIRGDWALAAWDARERSLLLAKDACGNATLYYYEGKGFIAFASNLKALLALPGCVKEPDLLRLAEVLVSWQHDGHLTAFKGFRRLVWAQVIRIDSKGQTRTWQHWSPEGREFLSLRTDGEYEEAFMEHCTQAVRSCLRTQKVVAATLSGGRDSGAVVALAAPLLASQGRNLTAYTSIPCLPADGAGARRMGNEWDLAHATAVMAGENVHHVPIDASGFGVIRGIECMLEDHQGPSHAAANHYWIQAVTEAAARGGATLVLTGQMGNASVSWEGNGSALGALLRGNPKTASRLMMHAESNPWLSLKRQVLKPILWPGLRAFYRIRSLGSRPWQAYSALNPSMAMELKLESRMRAAGHDPTFMMSPLEDRRLRLLSPAGSIGIGIMTEAGSRHSITFADPTNNLSLVEFMLRVPDEQFRRRSQGSWLMQRSFRNRLPEPVLRGRTKGLQAADVGHRILKELPEVRQCLDTLDALPEARELLDLKRLRGCLEDLVASVDPNTTASAGQVLLRGLGVGIFLQGMAESRW